MTTLDIGGEGRYPEAWNLNISKIKTLGPDKGQPIPRWVAGSATAIPLPDSSVDRIIMERTPLTCVAIDEMLRILKPGGDIILRHFYGTGEHPHALARCTISGHVSSGQIYLGNQLIQETAFRAVSKTIPPAEWKPFGCRPDD